MDRLLDLFPQEIDNAASGKTVESLRKSRAIRREILAVFDGELPQSIMRAKRGAYENDLARFTYRESSWDRKHPEEAAAVDTLAKDFSISGKGAGALLAFPQNIGRAMIRLYTRPRDTFVDPFMGHNGAMELCVSEGRHYVGYDISHRFMDYNFRLAERLRATTGMRIELYEADSREMCHTPDAIGDFTLTSPPYYNIEYYGDEPEQLGKAKTYDEFLVGLNLVAEQNFRVLKPGAFCIWFVNDFRDGGRFYTYHVDTINLLRRAGFIIHDMLIVDLGQPLTAAWAQRVVNLKILPKRHEYGIVARKP